MSCTCFRLRLLTGLEAWVITTSPSHATGVNTRLVFCVLPSLPRALPARSAPPLATASMPEAVLNGCSSILPWPAFAQAAATSLTTPCAVATSPRQIRVGPALLLTAALWAWLFLAKDGVARLAPSRATDNKQTRRTDMTMESPGVGGRESASMSLHRRESGEADPAFQRSAGETSSFSRRRTVPAASLLLQRPSLGRAHGKLNSRVYWIS